MKKFRRLALVLGICLSLALLSTGLAYSSQPVLQGSPTATGTPLAITATPQVISVSEIGSTDGIVALGGIIVLIIITPIFLRWRQWMRAAQ